MIQDRVLGPAIGARWQFDLDPGKDDAKESRQLRFRAGGLKSIDSALYTADADLRVVRNRRSGLLRQLLGSAEGIASLEPRGIARYDTRAWGMGVGMTVAPSASSRLVVDSRFTRAEHRYSATSPTPRWTASSEQGNRILFETVTPGWFGFFRAALWEENLDPRDTPASQRLIGRAGYAKEIPLSANQTIGLEILGGAGQTWGNIEPPRRFFAGGSQGEFFYESAQSRALMVFPDGPLLRSLGKAQGGLPQGAPRRAAALISGI